MNHRIRYSIVVFFLANLYAGITAFSQGYEIKATIKGLKDTTIILGHYLNKSMYPDDTAKIDKKGYRDC